MTIGPLSELSQMFGQINSNPVNNGNKGDDFSALIDKISQPEKDPYMENLPVASNNVSSENKEDLRQTNRDKFENKISDNKSDEKKNSDSLSTSQKDLTKNSVSNDKANATGKLKDEIINEAAKTLGVNVEDLEMILEQLGITAADLCNTENVSMLVAKIMGDGDMLSLVTDENASNMVFQLNELIADLTGNVSEEFGISEDMLKDWMADVAAEDKLVVTDVKVDMDVNGLEITDDSKNVIDMNALNQTDATDGDGEAESGMNNQSEALSKKNDDEHIIRPDANNNVVFNQFENNLIDNEALVNNEQVSYTSDVDPESIISQIREQVRIQTDNEITSLSMQLNPENLGTVNLTVAAKEGNVTAYITTTNEAVQAAIESQLAQLKDTLEQQGIKVEAIEVAVGAHEFEQNLEQGNDRNDAQEKLGEELKKATRKLNINGFLTDEDIEDLDEDQIVTAKMMRADGNSMDYKV